MVQVQMERCCIQAWLLNNESANEVEVRIAQIAELAQHTCRWGKPVNIKPMTPLITRYGTYTTGPPPR